jgi:DNA-binding NarL/FixJ family response regulator
MLRALRYRRADLANFDVALSAIHNRTPEAFDAALRAMRLAGQAGFARFLEAVTPQRPDAVQTSEPEALTAAEIHVLRCMALGLSNQAIADDQQRTINTVRTHVSSILRKLGAGSRGEAVAVARRRELV